MAMSLSMGGYGQGYPHPGPMGNELYQYPPVRYPDHHGESGYFQNWVLNPATTTDLSVMGDTYPGCGPPADYHGMHGQYELGGMRVVKRRSTANKKERRRTLSINNAFMQLRNCIPNVPSDTKLSKIKTLRLATSYIAYLMEVLAKDDPKLTETGFKAELTKKVDKEDKKKKEASDGDSDSRSSSSSVCTASSPCPEKKTSGRTGWPQHVWASELNNKQ